MIQEETVTLRKQTPEAPNEWLYEVVEENGEEKREFKPFVYLGKNAEPWPECTEQERQDWQTAWDEAHPDPEHEAEHNNTEQE